MSTTECQFEFKVIQFKSNFLRLPLYPIEQPALLCFPKTQDAQKPEWIDPHLPSIGPEQEEETSDSQQVVPTSPQVGFSTRKRLRKQYSNGRVCIANFRGFLYQQIETTIRRTEDGPTIKLTINKRAKVSFTFSPEATFDVQCPENISWRIWPSALARINYASTEFYPCRVMSPWSISEIL